MVNKRLVLLGTILKDLGFPDEKLIEDISTGFKLSGWMPDSTIFPNHVRGPTLTLDALRRTTSSFNSKVQKQMKLKQNSTLEVDTWNETEHKLEQGWIWETRVQNGPTKQLPAALVYIRGRRPVLLTIARFAGSTSQWGLGRSSPFIALTKCAV